MAGEVPHELDERSWLYRPSFPDEWERMSLLSMARWVNGLAFRDFQFSDTGKPVIKIAEIKGGITGQTKFTNQTFEKSVFVTNGDMLFSWSGQPETSIDVFWWRGRDGWLNQHIFKVTPIEELDPVFFFYVLRYLKPNFIGIARNKQTTGLGHVTRRDIENIEAAFPPLAEQKAIAAVLGALDAKIELNRRMNATLEAMARALFQSWFVDFDPVRAKLDGRPPAALDPATAALFPDSFRDSALGPIPHGWRAAHLEEIASVGSGKRPEGRCDVLSPESNIPLYGGGGRMGYVPGALYEKPILFTGRVGTLGLIFRTAEPSWPSDNTLIVEPQAGHFDFTYFVLKGFDLITLNRGSTQPLLTQTDLKRQTFVLPTKDVVKAFADFSEPIFRQIVSNERESRTLATLRDTLLPKLLSGELSVAEIGKEVPA